MNETIVFVAAKRTPFGAFGGSLKDMTATDMAVSAAKAAIAQSKIDRSKFDHVVFGNVMQTAADAAYLARHVGLRCELPEAVPAVTVNRLCGSGFESIAQGARLIETGEASVVLVGGAESMSQSPYVSRGARFGVKFGHAPFEDALSSGLYDTFAKLPMALTAENLAQDFKISRTECDEYALSSQQRATKAIESSAFKDEIAPIEIVSRKGSRTLELDEHVRPATTLESLAKLNPVFKKDGVVTAGNASGMVDGACALVLTTEKLAKQMGAPILGKYLGSSATGCDPTRMGIGPVPSVQKLLKTLNVSLDSIDLVEINEAFAPQYLAVEKKLGLDRNRTNTHGGAIAIGHPLGATGSRLVTHLLYQVPTGKLGLASACIGGGQGMSVLIESV